MRLARAEQRTLASNSAKLAKSANSAAAAAAAGGLLASPQPASPKGSPPAGLLFELIWGGGGLAGRALGGAGRGGGFVFLGERERVA